MKSILEAFAHGKITPFEGSLNKAPDYGHTNMITNFKPGILRANKTGRQGRYTYVAIRTALLAEAGFFPGAAVCAVPMCDGFTAWLQNSENAGRGQTFRVGNTEKTPHLIINISRHFPMPEISAGDFLVAAYGHGRIAAKKLPAADKYYLIDTHSRAAHLQLYGAWLADAGFPPDTIVMVAAERGKITLNAWADSNVPYGEIVKYAKARKLQIAQTRKHGNTTTLDLFDWVLRSAGFVVGDICGVRHKPGEISLFKPGLATTAASLSYAYDNGRF